MTDPKTEQETMKTRAVKFYISEEAMTMLEELGRDRYPGRPRVQSQTVETLIREAHARVQQQQKQQEGKR